MATIVHYHLFLMKTCAQYCFQEPRVNAPTLRSLIKTEVVNGTTMDNVLHRLNGEELFCQDFKSWPS